MSYQEMLPDVQLQAYVRCIWTIDEDHSDADSHESATPDSYIELISNLGGSCHVQGENESRLPDVCLVGLQDKPLMFRVSGITKIVGVRFYPWGVLPFKGLFMPPLNSLPVALDAKWDALSAVLKPMTQTNTFQEIAARVELFLLSHFRHEQPDSDLAQVQEAGSRLYATNGQTRIDDLAAYCGFSSRQLERQFKALAGVSPKKLARAIRFEMIALRLFTNPAMNLLDLAYEFGYADQAHFIHDFKAFAQLTPGDFAEAMRSYTMQSAP